MRIIEKLSPEWSLRIGIGAMYLYSGSSLIRSPEDWDWALPSWLKSIVAGMVPINAYLRFQGSVEIIIALAFLAWFLKPGVVKWFVLLSVLEVLGILFVSLVPPALNFAVTFRDVGLLGGVCALFLLLHKREFSHE